MTATSVNDRSERDEQSALGTPQEPAGPEIAVSPPEAETPTEAAEPVAEPDVSEVASAPPSPAPGPRPGPLPGGHAKPGAPRPAPSPAAVAQHVTPHPAPRPATSDPRSHGRIDPDGTVWLITAAGERNIGSWHAGDAEEGLQHFVRRFEDLETEVVLLENRLSAGTGEASKTVGAARGLLEGLPDAAVIGDVDALEQRLSAIVESAQETSREAGAQKARQKAERTARKEELAVEAETIANESTDWKTAGDRMRTILDEWKSIRGVDRKVDDVLWKRYAKARDTFNRRRGSHFAQLDRDRSAARSAKEELVVEAEALSASTDWAQTSTAYRDLLTRWKAAGRASRDIDDALWARFKGAQDIFFAARSAADAALDEEFARNGEQKDVLLTELDAVDPGTDLEGARAALRRIRDQWDEIGKVPRNRMADLEGRLRAYEKRVRDATDAQWKRTDPEADARAEQFRERLAHLEDQLARAEAAGRAKDAAKLRPQVEQWRQWAEAAASAVADR